MIILLKLRSQYQKTHALVYFFYRTLLFIYFFALEGSDFIWDFGKLPFPAHLGKYIIKNGKISTKIHEIGKIKTIFGLGMTPI